MHKEKNTPNTKSSETRPYLSMVTPSRNDDYGGGMLQRLQFSFNILFEQLERHKIESELIIVDWNPPGNRKRLKDALIFPEKSGYLTVRVLEVPPEIHNRYLYAKNGPMHGAVAFNVGLSRARGLFSVIRVSDIIWPEELFSFIGSRKLDTNTKYRCTRYDVDEKILNHPEWSVEQKIRFCKENTTMKMVKMKYYVRGLPDLLLNSDGDFQLLSAENTRRLRGYRETEDINSANCDGLLEFCAYAAGIKDKLLDDICIYKIEHERSYKSRVLPSIIPFYDILGRYFPKNLFSQFFIKILRMSRLTRCFYDNRVIKIHGIKQPTRNEYYNMCRRIVNHEMSYVLNDPNWGLAQENIEEHCALKAAWDM